ncbi:protein FAM227B isoform X2 [Erinaceus europaeus]|uniref:Protein FAM227B isoform X2 n=1 Tax=Erinaceus europaeus TaxID=9365 RepID=A0ABM3W217_ERIEU|nr:protein FAM227B isoform X2 [Erinaceus europaeus]
MTVHLISPWTPRVHYRIKQEPPRTIEEFLKLQNWDYWPRDITLKDVDKWSYSLNKIKEDSSFISIYSHLWGNVPRVYDAALLMDSRLEECSALVKEHASKLFEWGHVFCKKRSPERLQKYKAALGKCHKKKKIMLSDEMETKKNIEDCSFSGFKADELTHLPRHLDAKRIYLFILKSRNFDEKHLKVWKTHFLSQASVALLHDSFWWWFLHKFKPDRENQDFLFDRISESYVILFMSIPLYRKDAFFRVYPDCLAQAIYATFQEAFPDSSDLFNDEFKEELGNNISLWLSGLRPRRGFWTQWKLKELATTTIHGSLKTSSKSLMEQITRSNERITNTIDFDMTKILSDPRFYNKSASKSDPRLPAKSHYVAAGPEFNRVLFNFGGKSPLILYYLKIHELTGISKAPKQIKIKFTEICREPSPTPTYRDVIKEARRYFLKNQKEFKIESHRTNEEIKLIRQQQERIDKEFDRLQEKATKKPHEARKDSDKFLYKLFSELQTEKEFLASLSSSAVTSTTEDNFEEAEGSEVGNDKI